MSLPSGYVTQLELKKAEDLLAQLKNLNADPVSNAEKIESVVAQFFYMDPKLNAKVIRQDFLEPILSKDENIDILLAALNNCKAGIPEMGISKDVISKQISLFERARATPFDSDAVSVAAPASDDVKVEVDAIKADEVKADAPKVDAAKTDELKVDAALVAAAHARPSDRPRSTPPKPLPKRPDRLSSASMAPPDEVKSEPANDEKKKRSGAQWLAHKISDKFSKITEKIKPRDKSNTSPTVTAEDEHKYRRK